MLQRAPSFHRRPAKRTTKRTTRRAGKRTARRARKRTTKRTTRRTTSHGKSLPARRGAGVRLAAPYRRACSASCGALRGTSCFDLRSPALARMTHTGPLLPPRDSRDVAQPYLTLSNLAEAYQYETSGWVAERGISHLT